jgi:hypothetical protein
MFYQHGLVWPVLIPSSSEIKKAKIVQSKLQATSEKISTVWVIGQVFRYAQTQKNGFQMETMRHVVIDVQGIFLCLI